MSPGGWLRCRTTFGWNAQRRLYGNAEKRSSISGRRIPRDRASSWILLTSPDDPPVFHHILLVDSSLLLLVQFLQLLPVHCLSHFRQIDLRRDLSRSGIH
ncbi:hypothetical protein PUN28_015866 [Cardiocondyla obscurior]|uniref:Uncharacterized protein n=1 Tax=Cardiocondyla obscurior TaxID=286306 RepID=A0AAW2EPS0_9HYME